MSDEGFDDGGGSARMARIPSAMPDRRQARSARILAALEALNAAQRELTMAILDVPQ